MLRHLASAILVGLLAGPVSAQQVAGLGFVRGNAGTVGAATPPASQFEVYNDPSCVVPPVTWGKQWYFSPDPAIGQTPAQQTTAGVPAANQGNAANPFFEANAIFSQNGTSNYAGWTHPLAAWVPYRPTISTLTVDFAATGNVAVTVTTVGTFNFLDGQIITRNSDGAEFLVKQTVSMVTSGVAFDVPVAALYPGAAGNTATAQTMTVLAQGQQTGTGKNGANFTGSISGTALTVSGVTGTIATGQTLGGSGVAGGTTIVSGSGTSWVVSGSSQSIAAEAMTTGPGAAGPTFSAVTDGALTGGTTFAAGDPSHLRMWPGDEVILEGDTNSNGSVYPSIKWGDQIQWAPGGVLPNYDIDPATGDTKFVYIHGPSTGPVPILGAVLESNVKGVILANVMIRTDSRASLTTSKFGGGMTSSNGNMPANGNTFSIYDPNTATTDTWTWVTTLPGSPTNPVYDLPTKEILIAPGDGLTTWNNSALGFNAEPSGPTSLATYAVVNAGGGFYIITLTTKTTGLGNLLKYNTTWVQTTTEPTIDLTLNGGAHSNGFAISASDRYASTDLIAANIQLDGWTGATAGYQKISYPSSGSLGIDPATGLLGTPGGPWNSADWPLLGPNGFSTTGVVDNSSPLRQSKNASCIAFDNDTVAHVANGYGAYASNHVLFYNDTSDYAGQDSWELYSSWLVTIISPTFDNAVDNGLGFHPDGIQTGITVGNSGTQDEDGFWVNGGHWNPPTDPNLVNPSYNYTDFNSNSDRMAVQYSGFQQTVGRMHDYIISNNVIYTHSCKGITAYNSYDGVISGNTVIYDGSPVQNACTPTIAAPTNPASGGTNVLVTNNVAPLFSVGVSGNACDPGVTFSSNVATGEYVNGVVSYPANLVCNSTTNLVEFAHVNAWAANIIGIAAAPDPSTVFTADTPPVSGQYDPTKLDGHPISGSPLLGAGSWPVTDPFGITDGRLNENVDGTARSSAPNIGAW